MNIRSEKASLGAKRLVAWRAGLALFQTARLGGGHSARAGLAVESECNFKL